MLKWLRQASLLLAVIPGVIMIATYWWPNYTFDDSTLTKKDLEHMCRATYAAGTRRVPDRATPADFLDVLRQRDISNGLQRMIDEDLGPDEDWGEVISEWRHRSDLPVYECASLEALIPGSTDRKLAI